MFEGKVEVTSTPIVPHEGKDKVEFVTLEEKTTVLNFWFLSVDVPGEVDLQELMKKYDGETKTQGRTMSRHIRWLCHRSIWWWCWRVWGGKVAQHVGCEWDKVRDGFGDQEE